MAFGTESYRDTFSGSLGSYIASKIQTAAQNAKQEKENQKKAEELGIEIPQEEKTGLFKRALGYEFGGRKFDQKIGPWMKGMSSEQSSKKAKFSDQFSYTKALKQTSKTKKNESLSAVGRTTKKKGSSRASFVRGFGEVSLQLEQLNQRFSSLVSIANQQLGASYRMSGGIAGLHNVVAEQADVQRDQLDEMKSAKREASIEQSNLQSGSEAYKQTTDLTPGSDEFDQPLAPGATSPSVPGSPEGGGGGGLFDTIAGVADMADTALDVGRTAKNIGKRGIGRGLTRAGAAVGGRKGAKAASKLGGIGSKFFGKAAGKGVAKAAGKGVAKGIGKSLVKKIPIVGALAGIGFGVQRAMSGDWLGAAGEVASGLAATVPGAGTAVSAGIDAALIGKDIATPEKQAEGGIMPLSSRMAMNMIPGIGPLASMMAGAPGMKDAMGKGKNLGIEEARKLPLKAIGGAILSVTSGFIKALGPVAGVVAPMISQQISPLARMLGMPSSLVSFGGIGGAALSPAPQAMKMGMDFMKDFMNSALEKLGIKPKKEEEKTTSSGSSGSSGSSSASDDSSTEDETPSASPSAGAPAAPAPGMRAMTGDEYAAKVTNEVKGEVVSKENLRGGGSKNIYGITDARLAVVKNSENGSPTPYYHDTFGQLYKMNPNDGKVTRVTQDEITAAQSIAQTGGGFATGAGAWHFFRKPDKNVVLGRLQSMPVGSVKLATREIVYEEQSGRSGRTKKLRQPSQDEKAKYGIDQIKTPFGTPSAPVPQVQAASGVSITSNGGGNKQLTPGRTFGFADLNPHHSDEGKTRVYGGMSIGVPKDYGMGVLPNYMPSGSNGRVPLPVPGKVLVKEWNKQSGYGRTVIVETNMGKMQFSHLSKFGKFNVGDQLAAGAVVGVQGGSGDSGERDYAEHLHLNATKKGHEAFVNFITSGKPTTGVIDDTDSPGNEDAGNNQEGQEPEDPMEALRQNITGLLGNASALGKAFAGSSYEEASAAGKGIDFKSLMSGGTAEASSAESTKPAPATQPQAAPTRPNPTMQPAQTTPVASGKPAQLRPTSSDASSAQIASAAIAPKNTNSIVPVPMGANVPASGFRGVATEFSGSARDLRPIHPNLA
jgi:hypothetical protein